MSTSSSSSSSSSLSKIPQWTDTFGSSALKQVQNLASVVSAANDGTDFSQQGGGNNESDNNKNSMSGGTDALFSNLTEQRGIKGQNRKVVLSALESLERDSTYHKHSIYY